jgi:hypothetical protein
MQARKKGRLVNKGFRPGRSRACEAQLWKFTGPPGAVEDDAGAEIHWVAAESLDAALLYLRKREEDFMITEARFQCMIALLSGSPLD